MTALNSAISRKNAALVDWHLSHAADPNFHTGSGGDPLARAAVNGMLGVVRALLEHGASLQNTEALVAAAANFDRSSEAIEIMEYLLDAGADINYVEKAKMSDLIGESVFTGTCKQVGTRCH
ncbi:hypothetical protein BCR34DRAFT_569028 [Clohesyomyces aquaticus]|uniref:Uncharacterized protein n=1 Tax=Clohesyomyces aquaticus TaxID=1231657 RepID=A0A1Y1ZFI0_9PLEO|nr:hypothetical protein BCR34DRAFT_569028 [Clohesyomyces aquaticus]